MTYVIRDRYFNLNITVIGEEDKIPKFGLIAWEIQNWVTHCFGLVLIEGRLFRVLWNEQEGSQDPPGSCSFATVSSLWLASQSTKHHLWARFFLRSGTPSRAQGVWLLVQAMVPSMQDPS
jgi:hypothetical protein